ncbi:ferredoxin [Dactylosporangium sp. NBC_01737]|uniref:ferredoxin n=1 Tax=Dactylosporangium sp. NBC_01737 TaxID=2975959 RepID=UPI002E11954E|nr:ferredoxin [Dactylosporangium sp. NBC_01737]
MSGIEVDRARCDLYGTCAETAPDLFRLDETDDELVLLASVVPPEQLDAARRAIDACPKTALRLVPA